MNIGHRSRQTGCLHLPPPPSIQAPFASRSYIFTSHLIQSQLILRLPSCFSIHSASWVVLVLLDAGMAAVGSVVSHNNIP